MWTKEMIYEYTSYLTQKGFPVIFDIEHIRRLLGMKSEEFYKLINSVDSEYYLHKIPKRNGYKRALDIPSNRLKYIQRWVLENILNCQNLNECVTGFRPKKSIVNNARPHLGALYILKTDIKDFFSSITLKNIIRVFKECGYTNSVSIVLAKLCTYDGHLPQGAPTSPYLANIVCQRLDSRLMVECERNFMIYTRYADDITISSRNNIKVRQNEILKLIEKELLIINKNLHLNSDKTIILGPGQRKIITGISVNSKISVPKTYLRRLRLELYFSLKGVETHVENYNNKHGAAITVDQYRRKLYGKICFVNMVDQEKAQNLFDQFYKIVWPFTKV